MVVRVLNKFGAGQKKWSTYLYIISGLGRKSGGAIALVALVRWAPLMTLKIIHKKKKSQLIYLVMTHNSIEHLPIFFRLLRTKVGTIN